MRFLCVLAFLSVLTEMKAQPVSHYFVQMPSSLLPTVTVDARKDLVDFYKNGMAAVMKSSLGGQVELKEMSEDYLMLQTSENGNIQLKLLQLDDTTRVLAMVETAAAPLMDSRVRFFTTLWTPVKDLVFPTFTLLDFIDRVKGKALGLEDRYNQIGLRNFISCKFSKDKPEVVVHSSIKEDIRPEILKEFAPIICDSLTLVWNKGHFDLQK
jgi:Protein of unknown function (DUF3256).